VLFDEAFVASGAVCLLSADINGQLSCWGAWLTGRDKDGNALHGDGIKVGGDVCLDAGFIASGAISLASAHMGTLRWAPGEQVHWRVDLEGADVAQLKDSWTEANEQANGYWPDDGRLHLDGFTYRRFGGKQQPTAEQRLRWIRSQYRRSATGWQGFATQPYEQLATVYRQAGLDTQARKAAIAKRVDLRRYGNLNSYRTAGNLLLDKTIRYGYQTWRAAIGLAIVFVAFLALSIWGQHHHMIVPVGNIKGLEQVPSATMCTPSYPCFYPAGYAVDTVIPIIKVGQAQYWGLNGDAPGAWAFVMFTWIATGLGWALGTLLVTGYTGLVRKE